MVGQRARSSYLEGAAALGGGPNRRQIPDDTYSPFVSEDRGSEKRSTPPKPGPPLSPLTKWRTGRDSLPQK